MIVCYKRVSTADQKIARQLVNVPISFEKEFVDYMSGKNRERPELKKMIEFVRDGDIVYVHDISRLARDNIDLQNIVKELINKGVTIKFIKENLEFSAKENNPFSQTMLMCFAIFADFQRTNLLEAQRAGIEQAKLNGVRFGNKPKLNQDQKLELIKLFEGNQAKTEIAKQFKITRNSVYRIYKTAKAELLEIEKFKKISNQGN